LLEYFRGHPHEATIGQIAASVAAEEVDEGEEEKVFEDTIERLHQAELSARIDALNVRAKTAPLSAEEQRLLAELLAGKAKFSLRKNA
jgi:hypothetical protein